MGMRGRVGTPTALALYSTLSFSVSRALSSDFSLSSVFVRPFLLYILFCLSLRQFYPLHFYIQSYFSLSPSFTHFIPLQFLQCTTFFDRLFLSLSSLSFSLFLLPPSLSLSACLSVSLVSFRLFNLSFFYFHFLLFSVYSYIRAPLFVAFSLGTARPSPNFVSLISFQFTYLAFVHLPRCSLFVLTSAFVLLFPLSLHLFCSCFPSFSL